MRGRFVSLFVLFALIFGAVVLPATSHAEDFNEIHASDILKIAEHNDHQGNGEKSDAPCHAVVHHHCNVALAADGLTDFAAFVAMDELITLASSPAMSSFAQAPPTEPPAA